MRDKKFLIGAALVLLFMLVVLAAMFLVSRLRTEETTQEDMFPDSQTRDLGEQGLLELEQTEYWMPGEEDVGVPVLRALSTKPVAGSVLISNGEQSAGNEQYARFVDRSSGHILQTPLERVDSPETLASETMLRIGRVFWSKNGSSTLLQRLDNAGINVYSYLGSFVSAGTSTGTSEYGVQNKPVFTGRHLEYDNVITAALSPDATSIFYIVRVGDGSAGYIESVVLGTRQLVWSSPLTNLTAEWVSNDKITIYNNPSSIAPGFVWTIDSVTGENTILLGNQFALAARLSPFGGKLLYSFQETSGGLVALRVLDIGSGEISYVPSSVASIVEKCVWDTLKSDVIYCAVPRNLTVKDYLENWQYGLLASDDAIWQINISTEEVRLVIDPKELANDAFDIVDLQVSPMGDFLVFRTRANDILWSAQIPEFLLPAEEVDGGSDVE